LDIPGMGLESLSDFERAWQEHGETILTGYLQVMAGSRPYGLYAVGKIPVPPLLQKPYPDDTGRQIGTTTYFDAHCYGACDEGELDHLRSLGLVDAAEERKARQRLKEHGPRQLYSWCPSPLGDTRHAEVGHYPGTGRGDS
jgi:hypothetical protein